jgi:REP element-mobilizing transposase RayT
MKQRSFFPKDSENSTSRIAYGGNVSGRRRMSRPLDRKRPLHIVLKSSHAKGALSLLSARLKVAALIDQKAKAYAIKIHGFQNMGNHIHLMVSFKTRQAVQKFLRVISGLIARLITKAEKGRAFGKRFWDHLVFTRIVTGRRDYLKMQKYLTKNEIERELGQRMRDAVELHEKAVRESRRLKLSLSEVMAKWLEETQ